MQKSCFLEISNIIKVPVLSPEDSLYINRIERASSLVRKAAALWEASYPSEKRPPHHDSLGHLVRLVAESLPSEVLQQIERSSAMERAAIFLEEAESLGSEESLEKAFKWLHEGLSQLYQRYAEEHFDEIHDPWELNIASSCSHEKPKEEPIDKKRAISESVESILSFL